MPTRASKAHSMAACLPYQHVAYMYPPPPIVVVAVPGQFALFMIYNARGDQVLSQWPNINCGLDNHPVCIVGTRDYGRIACCLPATSFRNRPIRVRFPGRAEPKRRDYLAVEDRRMVPHDGLPTLRLADGAVMFKQTYVNTTNFFEVESRSLLPFGDGGKRLDGPSVLVLQEEFRQVLAGNRLRPAESRHWMLPMDFGRWEPSELGVPEFRTHRGFGRRRGAARCLRSSRRARRRCLCNGSATTPQRVTSVTAKHEAQLFVLPS